MLHELKCWPEFFQAILDDRMRFNLRRDDRSEGFQVGDELQLKEWEPNKPTVWPEQAYTGRELLVRVDYIMPAEILEILMNGSNQRFFTDNPPQFIVMSISKI